MRAPGIPRVAGAGVVAAVVAVAAWLLMAGWPRLFVVPHVGALVLTGASGLYMLLATWRDGIRRPERGASVRPIRTFDVIVGLLLSGTACWAL